MEYVPFIYYLDEARPAFSPDDIVIYPEIIPDNPLAARRVARFLLNRPWFINGKGIDYGDSDYLFAYSGLIDAWLPQLFLLVDDREKFLPHRGKSEKHGVSVYFGKSKPEIFQQGIPFLMELSRHDRLRIITRQVPNNKELLFDAIAKSRFLVSFDPLSNLNYEATLLDTPILLMDDSYGVMKGRFNIPLHGFFEEIKDLDLASKAVHSAWHEYENQLAGQDESITVWARSLFKHFENIDAQPLGDYALLVAKKNQSRKSLDAAHFFEDMRGSLLVNIEYHRDLPEEVQRAVKIFWSLKLKKVYEFSIDVTKSFIKNILKRLGLFKQAKKLYKLLSEK
jgi:hypothetical protein